MCSSFIAVLVINVLIKNSNILTITTSVEKVTTFITYKYIKYCRICGKTKI